MADQGGEAIRKQGLDVDLIYIAGSSRIVQAMLANMPANIWAALKFLGIREPIKGYGRLLEELP